MRTKVLITGANGFVGRPLLEHLSNNNIEVVPVVRKPYGLPGERVVGTLTGETDWTSLLEGVSTVIHLAARVHVMNDNPELAANDYHQANVAVTENLARQAQRAGVKRFIFLSSVKVLGEYTQKPWTSQTTPSPEGPYAKTKYLAEQQIQNICREGHMQWVIIRPPLVYGPKVKGNVIRLLKLVQRYRWIPLGQIYNHRSMVSVYNLCDLIRVCITHPKAASQILLVEDNNAASTSTFVKDIAKAMGVKCKLLPMPKKIGLLLGMLLNKRAELSRLFDSLQVDTQYTSDLLDWSPPQSYQAAIEEMVGWFKGSR